MRGRLVLGAFGFQALGALSGTVVGYLVLKNIPEIGAWRWMYATAIIPAVIVVIGRFSITESAHWLLVKGRDGNEAQKQVVAASGAQADLSEGGSAGPAGRGPRPSAISRRCSTRQTSARDDSRLRSMVPAGPRNLWHRHLHADDPRRLDRPQDHACAKPRRSHQQRRAGGQGSGLHRPAC